MRAIRSSLRPSPHSLKIMSDKSPAERRSELREIARNLPATRKESPRDRRERWKREEAEDKTGAVKRVTDDLLRKQELEDKLAKIAKDNADDILRKQNPPH